MGGFNYFRYVIAVLLATGLFLVANIEQHLFVTILDLLKYDLSKGKYSFQLLSLAQDLQAFQLTSYISMLLFANLILKWNSKVMFAIGLGGTSLCHILLPVTMPLNSIISIILCIFQGFFHGMIFPFFLTVMSFWTPIMENTTLISISMFGYYLGHALCNTIYFKLAHSYMPFYIFGGLGLWWPVLWLILAKGKPSDEPKITQTELEYIQGSGNERGITTLTCSIRKRIFYTKSTLSIFVVILCNNFNFTILNLPVLKKMLYNTTLYSYLVAAFVIVAVAFASDHLRQNYHMTIIKKIIICIGLFLSAIIIPFIGIYYPEDPTSYSALRGTFSIIQVIIQTSYLVNLVDVMHHAAGYALGVFLSLAQLIAYLVALVLSSNVDAISWIVVALNVVGCLLYAICGSDKREVWVMNQAETTTEMGVAQKETSNGSATPSNISIVSY